MNTYKISKKIPHTDNRMTLLAIHDNKIKEFENTYSDINEKKKMLDQFLMKLKNIKVISNEYHTLKKKIKDLEEEIKELENKTSETEYYLRSSKFIKEYTQGPSNKGELSNKYIHECLSDDYILHTHTKHNELICKECNIDLILNHKEATAICPSCGLTQEYQDNDICNEFSEEIEVLSPYSYKKINHFKEWLSMFLGRESSSPPDEVIYIILQELHKDRIYDKSQVTPALIKQYLKKNNLNRLYEHVNNLLYRVAGIRPPNISKELEIKLISMFEETQEPFRRYQPKNRKNYLSYSYVLYKLCQLLEQNHLLQSFALLKSREKLYEQDQIWKNICNDLGWKFYPSI